MCIDIQVKWKFHINSQYTFINSIFNELKFLVTLGYKYIFEALESYDWIFAAISIKSLRIYYNYWWNLPLISMIVSDNLVCHILLIKGEEKNNHLKTVTILF